MRTQSRIFAFKVIFAVLFDSAADMKEPIFQNEDKLDEKSEEFAIQIVNTFLSHKTELEEKVSKLVSGYELDRIFKVDLALIYMALTEMLFLNTPKAVVINETLEIAKKFSTDKSNKFINGVLAKV